MKNKIGLHTHTMFSDSYFTPTKLIKDENIKGFNTTVIIDHASITGVELTNDHKKVEIHILGLFIDVTNDKLKKKSTEIQLVLLSRNKLIIVLGMDISYDEFMAFIKISLPTTRSITKYLIYKNLDDMLDSLAN